MYFYFTSTQVSVPTIRYFQYVINLLDVSNDNVVTRSSYWHIYVFSIKTDDANCVIILRMRFEIFQSNDLAVSAITWKHATVKERRIQFAPFGPGSVQFNV